jgi:uncharacterized protein YlxW (UPF0749 family)
VSGPAEDSVRPEQPEEPRDEAWRRLARVGAPRLTRANVLVAGLALALGFAFATQVQQTQEAGLEQLSQDDLLRVLDDVTQRSERLDSQLAELERNRDALRSGVDTAAAALEQAQDRVDELGILAGTSPANGPGITIVLSDPEAKVTGTTLVDIVQELRDAGAEVIQVGPVRVVAATYFDDEDATLYADGTALTRPVTITAIGDPATMASAMSIPGGVVDTLRQLGGVAAISSSESLTIAAVRALPTPRYATPVPAAAPTGG